jgi:hypothetical protein
VAWVKKATKTCHDRDWYRANKAQRAGSWVKKVKKSTKKKEEKRPGAQASNGQEHFPPLHKNSHGSV